MRRGWGAALVARGRGDAACHLLSTLASSLVLCGLLPAPPGEAASVYRQARIRRILDGREVYIDRRQARVSDLAQVGNTVSTKRSRAELLFDRRAVGLLGRESLIRLGSRCFRLDSGAVLVNGSQRSCLGSKVLGVRGTTYVLERDAEGGYVLSVLAGEAVAADDLGEIPEAPDILSLYPRLNPTIGFGASAFTAAGRGDDRFSYGSEDVIIGDPSSLILGDLELFLPLAQKEARSVLYSYTTGSANFDGYGGVISEVGYRWLTPENHSSTGVFVGYGGFENPYCFNSLVLGGVQWERSRWRLGAAVGANVDDCDNGLSYASVSLGVPVARLRDDAAHLSLTPYGLNGAGESWLGGRLALDVPATEALSFNLYGSYDPLFRGAVGGRIRYRIPLGRGGFVRDPNAPPDAAADGDRGRASAADRPLPLPATSNGLPQQGVLMASVGESVPVVVQGTAPVVVEEKRQAVFDGEGNLLRIRDLTADEYAELLKRHLSGQNPPPESRRLGRIARSMGIRDPLIDAITGISFLKEAGDSLSNTIDNPFPPKGLQPDTGRRREERRQREPEPVPDEDREETAESPVAPDIPSPPPPSPPPETPPSPGDLQTPGDIQIEP